MPANYVFVRGRTNALQRRIYTLLLCTFQRRRWAFARERYGYDIVARLLRIRRNLTYIPAPTNQHSTGRIARAVRSYVHLTMGHTNKVELTRVCVRMFALITSCIENCLEISWDFNFLQNDD